MTASRLDPRRGRARAGWALGVVGSAVLLGACRPGLPPEPPGEDPADPGSAIPAWAPAASPYEGSAFDGEAISAGTGHAHHHGHDMSHGPADEPPEDDDATTPEPAPPEPGRDPEGER